jgi:hypothetical protein
MSSLRKLADVVVKQARFVLEARKLDDMMKCEHL